MRSALKDQLHAYAGKSVGVIVRTASEIADALARNPFTDAPGNRVMALFVEGRFPPIPLMVSPGSRTKKSASARRELFVLYADGMADTRLRISSNKHGTARNMNTVAKLAEMTEAVA